MAASNASHYVHADVNASWQAHDLENYNYTGNHSIEEVLATPEEYFYYYLLTFLAPTLFGLLTVVGTLGNTLVIYVILSRKAMRTGTNMLLLNLAIADISFLLVCSTFKAYHYASSNFTLGDTTCKFVQYFLYVSGYVTVWTLVAVSALRFLTIVCSESTTSCRTKRNVFHLICLIWLLMVLLNIPTFMAHQVNSVQADGFKPYIYCGINSDAHGAIFVTFFVFAYALPLAIICLLYLAVLCHLHHAKATSLAQTPAQSKRTRRVCRVIVLVVVTFGLSWLPLHVNSLVAHYGTLPSHNWYLVFKILWNAMAYGNSCANPFIYNYFSQDFRQAFREVVWCHHDKRKYRSTDRGAETVTLTVV